MADTTGTLLILNGDQQPVELLALVDGSSNVAPQHAVRVNSAPVSSANPFPVVRTLPVVTPSAANAASVVTGGTAVTAFLASSFGNGAYITNPYAATESLFIDQTGGTPGTTAGGTVEEIIPGQTWRAAGPLTTTVQVNAASSGHSFTAIKY